MDGIKNPWKYSISTEVEIQRWQKAAGLRAEGLVQQLHCSDHYFTHDLCIITGTRTILTTSQEIRTSKVVELMT